MTIRGLALTVAAFVGVFHLAQATEIVVLVDGNRMDVKSYEIQARVVVVTTWDGKVQSFPMAWVDVEATKSVSHQYEPAEGIPPVRLQKARMLLDAYGVRAGVSGFFEELEIELRSIQTVVDRPTYDVVRGSFRAAFDGERVFDVVVAELARRADDALLDRWSRWMSLPETERMMAMENAKLTGSDTDSDDDAIDESRYLAAFHANADADYRQELIGRLDKAVRASEAGLEIASALAGSLQASRRLVVPNPPAALDPEQLRQKLWPSVYKVTIDSLLFTYRTASNEELISYLEFWESEDGRQIAELTAGALAAGVHYGADMAVRNVASGTGASVEQ